MEKKLKILLNNIIYKKLELNKIEEQISNFGIKNKKIINNTGINIESKYFFLANNIYLNNLTEKEKEILFKYIEDINNPDSLNKLNCYLESIMQKLLFEKTNDKYIYYGENNINNLVPWDSVALNFQYLKYDYPEYQQEKNEDFVVDTINYIQENLGPLKNIKVAIIECDEIKRDMIRII